jgi:hypothetical protein
MAALAIQVQDACNLSAVVKSFAKVTEDLWILARDKGEGTDWVNNHPVSCLFAHKIADLSNCTNQSNMEYAWSNVLEMTKETTVTVMEDSVADSNRV